MNACANLDANARTLSFVAWVASIKRLHPQAIASARQAVSKAPASRLAAATLAAVLARGGEKEEARAVLQNLEQSTSNLGNSQYELALVDAALGDDKSALARLEEAAKTREWDIHLLPVDRRLQHLRQEPRFQALCAKLGVPAQLAETALAGERAPGESRRRFPGRLARWLLPAAAIAALAAVSIYFWQGGEAKPFFRSPHFTKITTSGNATAAAISPDRQYVAYALDEGGKFSLWMRQVSIANGVQILPESTSTYRGITFSRDGSYIYYVIYDNNLITQGTLYRVPTLGGTPRKVAENVSGAVSLSPDNRREAFLRSDVANGEDQLIVSDLDGAHETKIASRKFPQHFAYSSAPAWSPDGEMIAVASEATDAKGFYVGLVGIRLQDGREKVLSSRRWQYVEQIAWMPGKQGVLLVGRDQESSFQQIWQVLNQNGEPRRLTNDLNDYYGISLSGDRSALVSSQAQTTSSIWIRRPSGESRSVKPGYGRYFDLSFADNSVVYASDASGNADIWSMNANGTNQQQLTANAHRNYSPAISPDGKYVAFHSNRTGTWNIWRMNRDGNNLKQLTFEVSDSNWPTWTPDGKYLVYHHISGKGYQTIWKVPSDGGTPVQITDHFALRPAVSPQDGTVACWYTEEPAKPKWKIAVLPPGGGGPIKLFSFPNTVSVDSTLRWTPDGKGITYTDFPGGVSRVLVQDLDGSPAREITSVGGDRIFSLD